MYSGFVAEVPSWPSEVTSTYCIVGFTENSIFVFFSTGKCACLSALGVLVPFPLQPSLWKWNTCLECFITSIPERGCGKRPEFLEPWLGYEGLFKVLWGSLYVKTGRLKTIHFLSDLTSLLTPNGHSFSAEPFLLPPSLPAFSLFARNERWYRCGMVLHVVGISLSIDTLFVSKPKGIFHQSTYAEAGCPASGLSVGKLEPRAEWLSHRALQKVVLSSLSHWSFGPSRNSCGTDWFGGRLREEGSAPYCYNSLIFLVKKCEEKLVQVLLTDGSYGLGQD